MCPITARDSVEIPVSRYTGRIQNVVIDNQENKKGEPVQYVKFNIETATKDVKGWNGVFKNVGYPANLTKQTSLGKFLQRMNIPFTVGQPWDEQTLNGLEVSFDTVRNGYFTNVVIDGMGPADE